MKAQSKAQKQKLLVSYPPARLTSGHSLFLKNLGDKFQSFSENIRKYKYCPCPFFGPEHVYYSTYGLGISHDKGKPPKKTFNQVCFFFHETRQSIRLGLPWKSASHFERTKGGAIRRDDPLNFTWLLWVAPKTPVKPEKKLRN